MNVNLRNRFVFLVFIRHSLKGLARWNLLVLMGLSQPGMAQSAFPTQAESLTDRQGLPQAFVPAITQDRQGFIWMATRNGLCRYDGSRFRVFQPDPSGKPSLASSGVVNVKPGAGGRLWVASEQGNLDLLDPLRETVRSISRQPFYQRHFGRLTLENYYPDRRNRLWLTFSQARLACVDLRTQAVRWYKHQTANAPTPSRDGITAVTEDAREILWVGTTTGLNRLDARTGRFTHYRHQAGNPASIPNEVFSDVCPLRNGEILLLSRRHVTLLDPRTGHSRVFPIAEPGERWWLAHVVCDAQGNVYFHHYDRVFRFNERQGVQLVLRPDWRCQALFVDRSDVLWIGTNGVGVRKYNLRASPFQTQPYRQSFPTDLLRDFLGVPDDQVPRFPPNATGYVFRHAFDGTGKLWFNVGSTPFYQLDLRTRQVRTIPFPLQFYGYQMDQAAPLGTDPQGRVWAIYDSLTVWYDTPHQRWVPFPHRFAHHIHSRVLQLVVDERALWLATATEGLCRVDRVSGEVRWFRHQPQPRDPQSLSNDALFCLSADPADPNRLWVGTFGGGAVCLRQTDRHLPPPDGGRRPAQQRRLRCPARSVGLPVGGHQPGHLPAGPPHVSRPDLHQP